MGFRIHRGIFQKLNAERTAYENTFKIDTDGRIKEVDSEGNVTAGYLKVGEQASDANTVDGLHASSFLRSDADDTASGNITFSGTMYFTDAANNNRLNKGASFVNPKDPWSNFHIKAGQGQMYLDASAYHIRPQNGSSDWVYIDSDGLRVKSGWLRVDGSQGIYFQSYGGGWRMTDSTWIRAYNDKNIYTGGNIEVGGTIRANGNGFYVDSTNVINSAGKFVGNIDNSETKSDYFIQEAHGNPRNNLGSPTVTEMALFDSQFRCMTDLSNNYTNLERLTFWVQQNEGDEWTEVTHSDTNKKRFLRTNNSGVVIPNRAYKFRVEFKAPGYVFANALYFYWSSNSHSTKVHVYKYNASQDTWHAHATSNTNVSSWPGHLYLPFSTIPWHETHTTSTGHHRYIRVEFIPNWSGHETYGDRTINLYGGQIWGGYPSGRRTVHSINEDGNYYFPANLYAEGGSGDGNRLATRSWVTSTAKAADANLLDGINSTSFLRSDTNDTMSQNLTLKYDNTNTDGYNAINFHSGGNASGLNDYIIKANSSHGVFGRKSFGWHVHSDSAFGVYSNGWVKLFGVKGGTGDIYVKGQISTDSYGTAQNWKQAYDWGNHADAGYAPSSHNHDRIVEKGTIDFGASYLQWTDNHGTGGNGENGNAPENPFSDWHHHLIQNHGNNGGYYVDIASSFHNDRIHFRRMTNGSKSSWREFWHTGNLSTTKVSNWDAAYGWGDHSTAGYVTSVTDALGYTPYQENTALSADKINVNAGHSTARVVISYNHAGDSSSENSGNTVIWTSEPGITYNGSGIGGNIHESGHYYGKRNANIPYGVALRFNVASGRAEFQTTNSTDNGSFRVGWYMDSNGNTVQQGTITASGYNKSNWDTAYGWGNHASAGYLTSVPNLAASKITSGTFSTARIPNLAASKITSGTFANARISQSSVTQHQGALSIAASQVTGLTNTNPVTTSATGAEASTLASIDFNTDENIATFTLADGTSYTLQMLRPR